MAKTSRHTAIFGAEDWKKIYKTYKEADFQSYNFETIRKTFIDYLQQYHPETFNDFTESSEFVALLDLMALMGQSLSFRNDINTRENFMDTAERRDSVSNLAKLVGYTPRRNEAATGYLKVSAISTTESLIDYNRNNIGNVKIRWNDRTNNDWQDQFTTILNAALVDSQKIGHPGRSSTIIGIKVDEYQFSLNAGYMPVVPFTANVDGSSMPFEIVNGTSIGASKIYEPAPRANAALNILYRNDNQGFASPNTGYFFYFKQGQLETHDFSLGERIANRTVDLAMQGVNNADVWLYKKDAATGIANELWAQVESIYANNASQDADIARRFYSVTSRMEDQITLNFGDGVFSDIPVGDFRAYARKSNGLEYVINPEEIRNVDVSLNYVSRAGRNETLTLTVGLTEPVTNAKNRENINDIKSRAPARFYTQNRMVNGEDYTLYPYTAYNSIIKSKAVNRSSIGTSRYLDLVDPTGKYSAINTFGSDGMLYKDESQSTFSFTFSNKNDIDSVIRNQVEPLLASRNIIQFYYEMFTRVDLSAIDLEWHQLITLTNEASGYFETSTNIPMAIGSYANDNKKYIVANALIKFEPPAGYHFSDTNRLVAGAPTSAGDKMVIWAVVKSVKNEGTEAGAIGTMGLVEGPVKLNNFVPTDAVPTEVVPLFNSDLTFEIEQQMIEQIELLRDFGLGFDHLLNTWYIIQSDYLDATGEFSLANAGTTTVINGDASWVIRFAATPAGYVAYARTLHYYFASLLETRFFFDGTRKIYDIKSGKVVNDYIKVLRSNTKPDSTNEPLSSDVVLDIIGQITEPDGYVNDYLVEVSFTDSDSDGIADDPDYFRTLVDTTVGNYVYFQSTVDFDNLERMLPVPSADVNAEYVSESEIALANTEYADGQIFYASSEDKFYELEVTSTARTILERTDYVAKVGRDGLYFQYKHNSPESRRINPGSSNIIDIFVVTSSYYTEYSRYIQDSTNTVTVPAAPTIDALTVQYDSLQDKKMTSDNIVLNSVKFKPLFGNKAASNLQAYIKVVKLNNAITSDSEVKSQVISAMNRYFNIDHWDFGDTFYFSELSAYLHSELGDLIGSVVVVPKDTAKSFGNLYEIRSAPNEIFVSAATVDDVVIIDALTASKIQNEVR